MLSEIESHVGFSNSMGDTGKKIGRCGVAGAAGVAAVAGEGADG